MECGRGWEVHVQESRSEENASSKKLWHRNRGNSLPRAWEHEGDAVEIISGFSQQLGNVRAAVMANGASLHIWQMALVLGVDLKCWHKEAQCQDCGARHWARGSAHCKTVPQDRGTPGKHCWPPNFVLSLCYNISSSQPGLLGSLRFWKSQVNKMPLPAWISSFLSFKMKLNHTMSWAAV